MDVQEVRKLDAYLKRLFGNAAHPRGAAAEEGRFRRRLYRRGVHRRAVRRRRGRRALLQFRDGDPRQRIWSDSSLVEPAVQPLTSAGARLSRLCGCAGRPQVPISRSMLPATVASPRASRAESAPRRRPLRCAVRRGRCRASGRRRCGCSGPGIFRRGRIVDQVLALIGRSVAEREHGETARAGNRLGRGIARIDGRAPARPAPACRRPPAMVTKMRSRIDCGAGARRASGAAGFAAGQAGSSEGHRKARSTRSCAPGPPLHRHADRRRRHVEGDAGDRDRQRRRVERDRRFPASAATAHRR